MSLSDRCYITAKVNQYRLLVSVFNSSLYEYFTHCYEYGVKKIKK